MLQKIIIATLVSAFVSVLAFPCMTFAQEAVNVKPATIEQKIDAKRLESVDKVTKISATSRDRVASVKLNDTARVKQRVENQVKRLQTEYGLNGKQMEAIQKLWLETELQQNELRSKLSALNSDRQKKFEELLTPEQKEKRGASKVNAKQATIEQK